MKLYFRDNFFNAGETPILTETNEQAGNVDLRSAFGSALDVYDESGYCRYSGKFPVFSNKWVVAGPSGEECGLLRHRMSLMSQRYEYEAFGRGVYELKCPAFSREYEVHAEDGSLAASFNRINGWFASAAYCLDNHSQKIDSYEWVAVILGMHAIQKRNQE